MAAEMATTLQSAGRRSGAVVMLSLLLALGATALPANVSVNGDNVHFTVDDRFISFTMDQGTLLSHWADVNLTSPVGKACLKALQPSFLRFGGTEADMNYYALNASRPFPKPFNASWADFHFNMTARDLDTLFEYFHFEGGCDIIFGVNDLTERTSETEWTPEPFKDLLRYSRSMNYTYAFFELANEPDRYYDHKGFVPPEMLVEDLKRAKQAVADVYGAAAPPFLGPDIASTVSYLEGFASAQAADPLVAAFTVHQYYGDSKTFKLKAFLEPKVLDKMQGCITERQQAVNVTDLQVWLGETSSTYGGGSANLSSSYAASFMWLDKLGTAAAFGVPVVMRQSWAQGRYSIMNAETQPIPDWYTSYIWKNVIGSRVLAVEGFKDAGRAVRSYAFCARTTDHPARVIAPFPLGSVAVMLLNVQNATADISIGGIDAAGARWDYIVGPSCCSVLAPHVQLNGKDWIVDPVTGQAPALEHVVSSGNLVTLQPYGIAFVVFPDARAAACV